MRVRATRRRPENRRRPCAFSATLHQRPLSRCTTSLAGLPVNARIEEVDRTQPAKLSNDAQATTIPGVDLAKLPSALRTQALQRLNSEGCTCGCDFTIAKCRIDDPTCGVSLPKAR